MADPETTRELRAEISRLKKENNVLRQRNQNLNTAYAGAITAIADLQEELREK